MFSYNSVRKHSLFRIYLVFSSSYTQYLTIKNCVSMLPLQSQPDSWCILGLTTSLCYPRDWILYSGSSKKLYELWRTVSLKLKCIEDVSGSFGFANLQIQGPSSPLTPDSRFSSYEMRPDKVVILESPSHG